MTEHFPITPTPELMLQWLGEYFGCTLSGGELSGSEEFLAVRAAQWGADQELEACCEWLDYNCPSVGAHHLRTARRPKPPSLKKQALAAATELEGFKGVDTIRKALEALPDD